MNRLALPEGGERKRNLTTTGLGEKQQKSVPLGSSPLAQALAQATSAQARLC